MQPKSYPEVSDDFGHWLAGFIDGEGCFSVSYNGARPQRSMRCQFRIALRSDDTPLLDDCQRITGLGSVYQQAAREGNANPSAMWHVAHREDTARLVTLLERYPLRSKKRRDFVIWAEAVSVRNSAPRSMGRNASFPPETRARLERLRTMLMEGRRWRDHESVLVSEPLDHDAVPSGCDLFGIQERMDL